MFDIVAFNKEISDLIRDGQTNKAEEQLLKTYAALRTANGVKELEAVACRLAHFYTMPNTEDLEKAKFYFLEREGLSPGAYTKSQTAVFYFYILGDFVEVVRKVEEINSSEAIADRASYYSALSLQGHALIKLKLPTETKKVLETILSLIKTDPSGLPYGDEMNLLEAAIANPSLAPTCREILNSIIPKIRSQEYVDKAKALLQSA